MNGRMGERELGRGKERRRSRIRHVSGEEILFLKDPGWMREPLKGVMEPSGPLVRLQSSQRGSRCWAAPRAAGRYLAR